MQPSLDCLFCKIIAGEIPAQKVAETDRVTALRDINPQAPTHLLFLHKTHTASHADTPDPGIYADLLAAARDFAAEQGISDYRLVINNGAGAGQTVYHLHLHLLAGRAFTWPPG